MLRVQYICFLLISAVFFSGCYKDKTNYNFTTINEVSITGIAANYTAVYKGDPLVVTPELAFSIDKNDTGTYTYKWTAVPNDGSSNTRMVVGTERNLNTSVSANPGKYLLYFEITDKSSGITWSKNTNLNVSQLVGRGWLVFGDNTEGNADLMMLAMPTDASVLPLNGLLTNNGLPALKKAKDIYWSGVLGTNPQALWIMTEDGGYMLNPTTFKSSTSATLKNMVFSSFPLPEKFQPVQITEQPYDGKFSFAQRATLASDGNLYYNNVLRNGEIYGNPVNRISNISEQLIRIAPMMAVRTIQYAGAVVFDLDSKRFGKVANAGTFMTYLADGTGDVFSWNQTATGREPVYIENNRDNQGGSTTGNSFALMKDASGNFVVYKFHVSTTGATKLGYFTISSAATGFAQATKYAFYSKRQYVFYNAGNKLYAYDYTTHMASLIKDFGTDEITMLKFDIQKNADFNDLYVATYNATGKGTIHVFKVKDNPNQIEVEETTTKYNNLNKVKNIAWRNDN